MMVIYLEEEDKYFFFNKAGFKGGHKSINHTTMTQFRIFKIKISIIKKKKKQDTKYFENLRDKQYLMEIKKLVEQSIS